MSDLLHETTAPLAWDSDGMPFQLPPGTVAFKVRLYTGNRGRPGVVWGPHGPVHLDPGATMDDLRAAVQHKAGSYRLYPVNEAGEELAPVACIEVTEREESDGLAMMEPAEQATRAPMPGLERSRGPGRGHARGAAPGYEVGGVLDVNELFRHMLASRDEHERQMTAIVHKLVDSTAMIQTGMAGLFKVTNDTIKVSSGLDAIGRLPAPKELDAEEIAEQLAEQLADLVGVEDDEPAPQPEEKKGLFDKVGSVMKGPVGMFVMNLANNLSGAYMGTVQAQQAAMQAFAKAEQAKAEAEAAEANATKEAIEEAMRAQEEADEDDEDGEEYEDDEFFHEEDDEIDEAAEPHAEPASTSKAAAPSAQAADAAPASRPGSTPPGAQTATPGTRADDPPERAASVHTHARTSTLRDRGAPSRPIELPPIPEPTTDKPTTDKPIPTTHQQGQDPDDPA